MFKIQNICVQNVVLEKKKTGVQLICIQNRDVEGLGKKKAVSAILIALVVGIHAL